MFSVCIPYRYLPERDGMLAACFERLNRHGWEVSIGGALQDGRFNRAKALNEAIRESINEWIVTMDVDMILPFDFFKQIHNKLKPKIMLTFDFFEGGVPRFPDSPGGVTVFHYELWREVGGYNEAYEGYGYEDYDFRDRVLATGGAVVNTHIPIEHIPHTQVPGILDDLKRNKTIYEEGKVL